MTPIFKANLFCTKGMYYLVKLKCAYPESIPYPSESVT